MDCIEARLSYETSFAIKNIAEEIQIKDAVMGKDLPSVFFDQRIPRSRIDIDGKAIIYDSLDPLKIYEEAAHALHLIVNDEIPSGLHVDGVDDFFSHVLMEAFGYFGSRLSGYPRKEETFELWRRDVYKGIEPTILHLKEIRENARIPPEKIIEYTPELRDTFSQIKIVRYGEKMYGWLNYRPVSINSNLRSALQSLVNKAYLYGKMVAIDRDYYSKLYHCIGYDLGLQLFRRFCEDREEGTGKIRKVIASSPRDSLETFWDTYLSLV